MMLVLSTVLIGCSNSSNQSNEKKNDTPSEKIAKKEGKDITIAVKDNFVSMDPHDSNDTQGYSAQKTMMEGLLGFDKNMKVVPVLAESYEANDGATEFTFKLRHDVKFHDGTPFNAEAVKVNIDRLADPANNLKRHSLFAIVKETQVVDEYTVKFILKEPFGAMINTFAHPSGMMHSPKSLAEKGKEVSQHPIGTGQYKFKEYVPGDHLTVVKNEDYWKKGYPKVDSITFKPVPENGARVAMLQTGEADFLTTFPTEQAESLNGKDGIIVDSGKSIIVRYLSMNTYKKPYSDVRVRQAINYAINKEAFNKIVLNGFGTNMDSIIAPDVQFYSKQKPYEADLAKAKKLLKEAGYENGFKAKIWGGNNSTSIKAMEFLQQQLAQIGVQVEVMAMEAGTLSEKLWSAQTPDQAEVEMYFGGWSPSTGDADWGIRPLLGGSDSFPPNSYNTAYYNNDKANEYIHKALATADLKEREAAYKEVQNIIWKDAPWAFLGVEKTVAGYKNYLEGIYLLPDGSLSVENMNIKQ